MFRRRLLAGIALLGTAAAVADELPRPRDPMRPFGTEVSVGGSTAATGSFRLTAVLISSTRRIAIVNGVPCAVGDSVAGAEIVRVEPDAVHLRRRGEEIVVSLGRPVAVLRSPTVEGEAAP